MKTLICIVCSRVIVGALAFVMLAASTLRAGTAFSKIVVFGDSLNDRGNMYQFTGGAFPAPPTYTVGRQTNGQVWVEYFAQRLGMGDKIVNYAVVGAMTKATAAWPTGNVWSEPGPNFIPGLEGTDVFTQVNDYLADANGQADPAALYILEGGANDFPRVDNPAVIITNLVHCLVALESRGAKHIVLVNLPDIGRTPRVFLAEQFGFLPPGSAAYLSSICSQINQGLAGVLPTVSPADVTITVADIYGFMATIAQSPATYGLSNVQLPYLMAGAGSNPAAWLFWDDLHATTRGHELFADQAFTSLLTSYSPGNRRASAHGAVNSLRGLVKATPKK